MPQHQKGFTLIELIIVIVLTSLIAVMISSILNRPLTAYFDTQRRGNLVDHAQVALNRMTIELEHATPNSIRIDASGQILEFMPFHAAGRYRGGNAGDNNALAVSLPDRRFNSLGDIPDTTTGRVVVYNTSPTQLYNDATGSVPANSGVITEADNIGTVADCFIDSINDSDCADAVPVGTFLEQVDRLTLTRNHRFDSGGSGSPAKIFYLVNEAVTYFCDPLNNQLVRYQGYTIEATQITDPATLAATATSRGNLAKKVNTCQFDFDPGNGNYRTAIVSILLGLQDSGEQIQLLKEVHLWNAP